MIYKLMALHLHKMWRSWGLTHLPTPILTPLPRAVGTARTGSPPDPPHPHGTAGSRRVSPWSPDSPQNRGML